MDNKPQSTPPNRPTLSWLWWVAILAMIAWYAYTLIPKTQPQVTLPYSAVLAQVKAGNVSQVDINGPTVNGTFNNPVTWPPATGATTPGSNSTLPNAQTAATPAP